MGRRELYLISFIAILPLWAISFYPFINVLFKFNTPTYPIQINAHQIMRLIVTTSLLLILSLLNGVLRILEEKNIYNESKVGNKYYPLIFVLFFLPVASAYVFDFDNSTIGQMILDLGDAVMNEDFDDTPPGEDPPGWEEDSGDWYVVDDGGNNVYYQNNDGDKEALTISTTGNTSWTDYSFLVDLKFDTGPANKPDRAALLVYRYTSGNDYYFLALREARDELEIFKHGTGGVGHLRGTAACTLEPGPWYSVNITIRGDNVWVSIDDTYYFSNLAMLGSQPNGSVGIGTEYYKVMFDNILVELRE
jgi:hypothetical protein